MIRFVFEKPSTSERKEGVGHARNPVARSLGVMAEGYGGKLLPGWYCTECWEDSELLWRSEPGE